MREERSLHLIANVIYYQFRTSLLLLCATYRWWIKVEVKPCECENVFVGDLIFLLHIQMFISHIFYQFAAFLRA